MKAYLVKNRVGFPKTHNLIELHELCLPLDGSFEIQRDLLLELNQYGARYRYPGVTAEKDDAKQAMIHTEAARSFLRAKLGLE